MEQWKLVVAGGAIALAGMGAGSFVFGAQPARAQRTYTECFIARQESLDTNGSGDIETLDEGHTIHVPRGWEVVGGGGLFGSWVGAVVLCR